MVLPDQRAPISIINYLSKTLFPISPGVSWECRRGRCHLHGTPPQGRQVYCNNALAIQRHGQTGHRLKPRTWLGTKPRLTTMRVRYRGIIITIASHRRYDSTCLRSEYLFLDYSILFYYTVNEHHLIVIPKPIITNPIVQLRRALQCFLLLVKKYNFVL